ncbi:hypothetical protein ABMA32_05860 [Mesorhizobium sp. VNQ89]|uniref:hypothetical protein n=1 Tax=Mesorhizobium quangtriensis TaxID=3157709 RepID=UPI0032B75084
MKMDEEHHGMDVWALASHQQIVDCMMLLSVLPARPAHDPQLNKAAYYIALEGVSGFALRSAVKRILQGSLGHGFFPSPPDLRLQCNQVMEPYVLEMQRSRRKSRIAEELPREVVHSDAEKQAVARIYTDFLATFPR